MASLFDTVTKLSIQFLESNTKLVVALANCNQLHIENVLLRSGGGNDNTGQRGHGGGGRGRGIDNRTFNHYC